LNLSKNGIGMYIIRKSPNDSFGICSSRNFKKSGYANNNRF
jgi:hypothetical protein